MAHLIEKKKDGTHSIFTVGESWHGLGVILNEAPTAADAIKHAQLDWTVSKRQVFIKPQLETGNDMERVPDQFAIVRDSDERIFGVTGKNYQPLQNSEAFRFFDPYVEALEAEYHSAGSLDNGKRIWVLAKIKRDDMEIVKGDSVQKYILLTNTHSGKHAVTGALTPIRVVCNNTLTMAMRNKSTKMFRATHSNQMNKRLEEIQAEISMADQSFKRAEEFYRAFAKKQVNKKMIDQILADTFEWSVSSDEELSARENSFKNKQTETIMKLFEIGRGTDIKGVKGTAWGLYNAITEYVQHEKGKLQDKRLDSAWFGAGMKINQRAFDSCAALVS